MGPGSRWRAHIDQHEHQKACRDIVEHDRGDRDMAAAPGVEPGRGRGPGGAKGRRCERGAGQCQRPLDHGGQRKPGALTSRDDHQRSQNAARASEIRGTATRSAHFGKDCIRRLCHLFGRGSSGILVGAMPAISQPISLSDVAAGSCSAMMRPSNELAIRSARLIISSSSTETSRIA